MGTMSMIPALLLLIPALLAPSSAHRIRSAVNESGAALRAKDEVPTVAFCEMVKNPERYFDKPVRLTARLDQATEAQYLNDDKCVLSHDDQIGVGYAETDTKQREALNTIIRKIRTMEYGSRAMVTVVGVLRNSSRRSFAWYRYRFDLMRIEDVAHVVVPYEGELQAGRTYLAAVRGDARSGLSPVIPLRIAEHHAVLIEWTNLREFPALAQQRTDAREHRVVFSVLSDEIRQMTERRWNRTLRCKIIRVV